MDEVGLPSTTCSWGDKAILLVGTPLPAGCALFDSPACGKFEVIVRNNAVSNTFTGRCSGCAIPAISAILGGGSAKASRSSLGSLASLQPCNGLHDHIS